MYIQIDGKRMVFKMKNACIIPKKIHYCWFGRGKKDKIFKKCYNSWKKYFPDYEIIEWNEDNFDINCIEYTKEAYKMKKYAFVSDYARLKIMYEYGGIYFDTDVEALKRIDDKILKEGYFAKEYDNMISTGLGFSTPPKNEIVKIMMDDYENIHFINNEKIDMTPCPIRNTKSLNKKGYIISKNIKDLDGIRIYSKEYFCGFDNELQRYDIKDSTYTVHHYAASWMNTSNKIIKRFTRCLSKICGKKLYSKKINKGNGRNTK